MEFFKNVCSTTAPEMLTDGKLRQDKTHLEFVFTSPAQASRLIS